MSEQRMTWTQADLAELSWHDNHIHGLRISEGQHGSGELELDLDHIVEWLCREGEPCTFRVAPATLTFHEVVDLRINIDYAAVTAGIVQPSIGEIHFDARVHEGGFTSYACKVEVNWPQGEFTFACAGLTLVLRRPSIASDHQCLEPGERA